MLEPTMFDHNKSLEDLGEAGHFPPAFFGLVQDLPLFQELDRAQIETLARYMRAYVAREETLLFREGDFGDFVLLVVEGIIQVIKYGDNGEQQTLALLERGRTLGEMSMVDGKPRSATCIALHDSVFLVLTNWGLHALAREQPQIANRLLFNLAKELSQRLRQTTDKLVGLLGV